MLTALPAEPTPTSNAWLSAALARYGLMAERLVPGFDARAELQRLNRLPPGAGKPTTRQSLLEGATKRAQAARRARVIEEDVVAMILEASEITTGIPVHASVPGPAATSGAANAPDNPDAGRPQQTPMLDRFGNDLTAAARAGKLGVVMGREREVDAILETLCRRIKRNPLLVGPPGTGKTALVEAVAMRVASGNVPGPLKNARIVGLQPSAIVSGGGIMGEVEQRMRGILQEAQQPGIILFIDEVHTVVGTGGREGTGDIASQLKPALARDSLVCIAATTDDEYRKFISKDGALERRFQPIRLRELSAAETLEILKGLRDRAQKDHSITVDDDVLRAVVSTSDRALPNRYFPDKAIDLFDQLVAHAMLRGLAVPDESTVSTVASSLYGMPTGAGDRLTLLEELLRRSRLLSDEDLERVIDRLAISLRGLDVRPERPNLSLMMAGPAAQAVGRMAAVFSEGLFGEGDRIVTLDCGSMQEVHDTRLLVGSPPGYIGYDDRHLLQAVIDRPCSIVVIEGLDRAHPAALETLLPGVREGVIVDLQGRRIHFSETVVLIAWPELGETRARVGFLPEGNHAEESPASGAPSALTLSMDVLVTGAAGRRSGSMLLDSIAARWTQLEGVQLEWQPEVVAWAVDAEAELDDPDALAAWGDREVILPLGRKLVTDNNAAPGRYRVERTSKGLHVTPVTETAEQQVPAQPPTPGKKA